MSDAIEVNTDYYDNGNKRYEILYLNGKEYGLARYWWNNGQLNEERSYKNGQIHGLRRWWRINKSFCYFDFWHKGTLVFEFWFKYESKATAPKPNKPIFSTNQFLELCQTKEQ